MVLTDLSNPYRLLNIYPANNNMLQLKFHIQRLYSCDLVSSLVEFYRIPECIILFGSYAKGEDTKENKLASHRKFKK